MVRNGSSVSWSGSSRFVLKVDFSRDIGVLP